MGVVIFIAVLSFLVIIHELGHFLMGRFFKMRVEEFGLGYPPKIRRLFTDKKGTEYTLNWLPFGGFVRLFGEDRATVDESKDVVGAFFTKPGWQRLIVILAGVAINFIFGVLAFSIIYTKLGIPVEFGHVRLEEIAPESPAAESGLVVGDQVRSIVVRGETTSVVLVDDFINTISANRGNTVTLEFENREPVLVYIRSEAETPADEGSLGVVVADSEVVFYPLWQMPFRGMFVGLQSAFEFGLLILQSLGQMVTNLVINGQVPDEVAGPIGIGHTVQREGILTQGWLMVLNFAAILSINLAIINLLPVPALDGGRAVFILLEMLSGKRVSPVWEYRINAAGFIALISLIVLVSIRDIKNLVQDQAIQEWFRHIL
jgi:regulator of sigma E protease